MMSFVRCRKMIVMTSAVLFLSLSLSGCETLRKKFTRTKKKSQTEDTGFAPVLEPEEYPAPENNPVLSYKQHYSLLKVWYKDLWTALEDKFTDKQIRYLLKQINAQIDEMQKLLDQDKALELNKLKELLKYFDDSLNSSWALRNIPRIRSDLRAFDRSLRKLGIDKVKKQLIGVKKKSG